MHTQVPPHKHAHTYIHTHKIKFIQRVQCVIPVLRVPSKDDWHKFQASLGYVVTDRLAWAIEEHPVLNTQTHKQQKGRDSSLSSLPLIQFKI